MHIDKNKQSPKEDPGQITVNLQFLGSPVRLSMPNDAYEIFLKNYQKYLPKFETMEGTTGFPVSISHGAPQLLFGDGIKLSDDADREQLVKDTILLLSKVLEYNLNKVGIFSLHASSVAYGSEGIAIIGQSGAGKTTSAVRACMIDKGISFVSGNRVFIDGKSIIAGTSLMQLRRGSLELELGIKDKPEVKETSFQNRKVSIDPENLDISSVQHYPVRIKKLISLKKLDTELKVSQMNLKDYNRFNEAFSWLYDAASKYSDYFPNIILGPKIPYPDMFGSELREKRVQFVSNLLDNVELFNVEGRLDSIAAFIIQMLRR